VASTIHQSLRAGPNGLPTVGGYSDRMVVHERFAIFIPKDAPLDAVAPLLCAGEARRPLTCLLLLTPHPVSSSYSLPLTHVSIVVWPRHI
jgi:hypothetical protein